MRKRLMLIIMDGLGVANNNRGNAVTLAQPQNLIGLWESSPHAYLKASGSAVGLPDNIYGNSEVGHMNIGAGKVVLQNLPKIDTAIEKGIYFTNESLLAALEHANKYNSRIHIIGCLSDGGVHAHIRHFLATLDFFALKKFGGQLFVHAFTDGRDAPAQSATQYLTELDEKIKATGVGRIATLCGRALAMDRNKIWDRTQKAYRLLALGEGEVYSTWQEAVQANYSRDIHDEYLAPSIITNGSDQPNIQENDVVLYLNYRADRAVQLSEAFCEPNFPHFPTNQYQNLFYTGMVAYKKNFPAHQIFPKEYIKLSIGRVISEAGHRQLRIAESEKFPHVTYFFNGGLPIVYPGEDHIEIPSPAVATYDMQPEMSAMQVTQAVIDRIAIDTYDFIVVNFANPDMVGHTGNLEACIKSVQVVDHCVSQLVKAFTSRGGLVVVTADHGNVEEVIKMDSGEVDTEHSFNPVPFMVCGLDATDSRFKNIKSDSFVSLQNIAPTILDLMDIQKPDQMQGSSLFA